MNYTTGNTSHDEWAGTAAEYSSEVVDDDLVQAAMLWDVLGKQPGQQPGQQQNFVSNVAGNLGGAIPSIQEKTLSELCILGCCWDLFGLNRREMFARVDETLAKMIKEAL
jgi:catalase